MELYKANETVVLALMRRMGAAESTISLAEKFYFALNRKLDEYTGSITGDVVREMASVCGRYYPSRDRLYLERLVDVFETGNVLFENVVHLRDISPNEENPYVRLKGKGDKERHVGLSKKSIPVIRQYIEEFHSDMDLNKPFIYSVIHGKAGRMSERTVERIISKYGDQVRKEMEVLVTIYPHMLRASRATGLYQDGVPIEVIASMLGHADINTTRDHYARPSLEQLRTAMEKGTSAEPEEQASWPMDEEELTAEIGLLNRRR